MYVVVNICPGSDMSNLMETLAGRALTFSVTDDLSKLCAKCSNSNNPLPVPHQVPDVPTASETTNGYQTSPKLEKKMPASRTIRKSTTNRKRGHEEEPSLSSEPDPAVDQELTVKSALHHLNHLASLAAAQSSSSAVVQNNSDLFRIPKEEQDTSIIEQNTSMNEVNIQANAMAMDLFKSFEGITAPGTSTQEVEQSSLSTRASTKDMFRGECRICQMPISIRSHHMRRHAMKHLGFKTFICKLCQKDFNRSDLCKTHFERYHPGVTPIPFEDIITRDQQDKLDQMIAVCFPEEHKQRQHV